MPKLTNFEKPQRLPIDHVQWIAQLSFASALELEPRLIFRQHHLQHFGNGGYQVLHLSGWRVGAVLVFPVRGQVFLSAAW